MNWNKVENKRIIKAIISLASADQAKRFLRDLMTEGEIKEFAKRFKTAEMLSNKVPYTTIGKETGFSSTTIARVSKWLSNGMGGYKSIINKLHHHNSIQQRRGLS